MLRSGNKREGCALFSLIQHKEYFILWWQHSPFFSSPKVFIFISLVEIIPKRIWKSYYHFLLFSKSLQDSSYIYWVFLYLMHSHSSVVTNNLRVTVGSLICGLYINGFNQLDWKYSGKKFTEISQKHNFNLPGAPETIYIIFTLY